MPDAGLVVLAVVALALALTLRPWIGAALCVVVIVVAEIPDGYLNPFIVVLVVGPWLVGWLLRSRQQLLSQLHTRGDELAAEREIFGAESVRYERARIARELHDIVAHCMSVVVVQAAAARHVGDPELTSEALDAIAGAAADAREEMGRLVTLLDVSAPPPVDAGLAVVTELVQRAQATGLAVSARIENVEAPLRAGIAETLRRIVQESMTNALKHAPGAPIQISVDGDDSEVRAVVANGPAPGAVGVLHTLGGSNGLGGMRERAARAGGVFEAGPTPDGGWRVAVALPR